MGGWITQRGTKYEKQKVMVILYLAKQGEKVGRGEDLGPDLLPTVLSNLQLLYQRPLTYLGRTKDAKGCIYYKFYGKRITNPNGQPELSPYMYRLYRLKVSYAIAGIYFKRFFLIPRGGVEFTLPVDSRLLTINPIPVWDDLERGVYVKTKGQFHADPKNYLYQTDPRGYIPIEGVAKQDTDF